MVFNAVFNSISVISRWPVHLSMLSWNSFNRYSRQYSFRWLLSHVIIVETTDSGERGMNPVAMTIINPREEYLPSPGIEPATSCSQVRNATDCAMGLGEIGEGPYRNCERYRTRPGQPAQSS